MQLTALARFVLTVSVFYYCQSAVYILCTTTLIVNRDSSVGIAAGYEMDDREVGVRVPVGSRIFTSPYRLDRLWGPPGLFIL
jgi:hypothetical protein